MSFTKADVQAIVAAEGVDNLTAKAVRLKLEAKLGLEDGALKSQKEEISKMIDEVLEENEDGGDDDEGGDDEEEENGLTSPPAKKQKSAAAGSDNPNKGKMTCKTKSGAEAPKGMKAMQVRSSR